MAGVEDQDLQSLRRAHDELESRVRERTAELAEAKKQLKQEIGHRRRAEEASAKFAAIVESSNDAIVGQKLDGTIVTWNAAAERMFGYTAEEARGQSVSILLPPDRADEMPRIIQAIRRGEPVQHYETERVCKDGTRIHVSLTVSPIKDAAGRIVGASRIARDITQRKRMEEALRESEARARAILDTAVDGIVTIDERGIIESFNRAAERLFGYSGIEVMGRNVSMLMPEPYHGEHDRYLRNYVQTGQAKIIGIGREVVGRRKDGSIFPLDLAVSEVLLGQRRLFTGMIRDLSERKRLEQEVLEVSDREKQRIGQDLHDSLGQLLAGVGFMSKSLEQRLASREIPETGDAKQIAELVTEAITQARSLARGLQPVEAKPTGLNAALEELATSVENLFRVTCSFKSRPPVLIDDATKATHVYRIAQEAVNNAIKHGRAKRIEITLARSDDGGVMLIVQDNGVGFSPTATPARRGLGLQIMSYRAAMIGGSLAIRPGADGGTIVSCTFSTGELGKIVHEE